MFECVNISLYSSQQCSGVNVSSAYSLKWHPPTVSSQCRHMASSASPTEHSTGDDDASVVLLLAPLLLTSSPAAAAAHDARGDDLILTWVDEDGLFASSSQAAASLNSTSFGPTAPSPPAPSSTTADAGVTCLFDNSIPPIFFQQKPSSEDYAKTPPCCQQRITYEYYRWKKKNRKKKGLGSKRSWRRSLNPKVFTSLQTAAVSEW